MTREQLIRALRRHARRQGLAFSLETNKGKGSHYIVGVGDRWSTIQSKLNPGRIERILKQLNIRSADL